MKFNDLFYLLCDYAPLSLSKELCERDGLHDNSGVILSTDREVKSVLFTLDLSRASAAKAKELGCDAIVTHHPAIYRPIYSLKEGDPLLSCARDGVGVISMHLNFDAARYGIDYYLAEGLGATEQKIAEVLGENVGYGRLFDLPDISFETLKKRYENNFNTQKVWLYGDKHAIIHKVATFCGAGLDPAAISFALENGADAVVSADISHHVLTAALEEGLGVLSCTHYATENYGMKRIAETFRDRLQTIKIYFFEDETYL